MRYGVMPAIARGFLVMCLLATGPLVADEGSRVEEESTGVEAAAEAAYSQALARFDEAIRQSPREAGAAVERCEFILQFTDVEGGWFLERASADAEACEQGLDAWATAPETQVYRFEQDWSDDARKHGDALLERADGWPPKLRQRLVAGLAERYRYAEDGDRERERTVTVLAAELGDAGSIGPAVEALWATGEPERAIALLRRSAPAESDWLATGRVRAALKLPLADAARHELRRHAVLGREVAPAVAALAYLRAGDPRAAKASLAKAVADTQDEEFLDAKFRVGMAMHDYPSASAAVRLNEFEHLAQNTGRFLALAGASPASLLQPAMWTSLAVLLALVLFHLLVPGLVLVPVHYRGLARRCAGRAPQPMFERVGLRHAWLAAVVFLLVPMCVLAVLDPGGFGAVFANGANPDPSLLLQLVTATNLISLMMFAPVVARFAASGHFSPGVIAASWKRISLAVAATLAVGMSLAAIHRAIGAETTTQQVEMARNLINSGQTPWAGAFSLMVIALLVPVWEEFAFRGMVMGGIARHIGFARANLLQALVFALCHNDWPRFPYYLVMGLLAGWLVRSTGKLAPAILMHMTINALAFFLHRG